MINNKAKNMYHAIKAMPIEDNSKAKSKKKGLLAPVRNFMKKKDSNQQRQPMTIVQNSWNLLNKARNNLNGND
jgi:hypothetical protein|tara:strand:+ start:1033 stop:1251 length:219 start_codon:yes stop_codon:yes gene_type:complete